MIYRQFHIHGDSIGLRADINTFFAASNSNLVKFGLNLTEKCQFQDNSFKNQLPAVSTFSGWVPCFKQRTIWKKNIIMIIHIITQVFDF